jgi:hypothetical protein
LAAIKDVTKKLRGFFNIYNVKYLPHKEMVVKNNEKLFSQHKFFSFFHGPSINWQKWQEWGIWLITTLFLIALTILLIVSFSVY